MCKVKKYIVAFIMLLPLLLCGITLYVDDDYTSVTPGWGTTHFAAIQDAIDMYSTGDVIFVYPGTYYEAIINYTSGTYIPVVIRSNYSVSGNWEDVENTVIDAYGQGVTAVTFSRSPGGVNFDVELNGFTVKNGFRGITAISVYADILNCIIENNMNQNLGGGLYTRNLSTSTLENCVFRNNKADDGGGIYSKYSSVIIDNCEFYSNEASGGKGGAICFSHDTDACNSLTISRSLFYENTADDYGGAIYYPGCSSQTLPELEINFTTFADNAVTTGNGAKGLDLGTDYDYYKSALIENSIFSEASPNISTSTRNCDINYSCLKNGCDNANADLSNCITSDPDFVSANDDDYHIKWGSGCIDTADPAADEDDDYSRADMGIYPYERDHFDMTRVTYRWVCYPRLDVSDDVNNGENDDYVLVGAAMNDYWSTKPSSIYIYDEDDPGPYPDWACSGTLSGGSYTWSDPFYNFFSFKGVKIQTNYHFYIGGYLMDPTYEFDDLTANQDNWVGYYLEESQHVQDAIDSGFLDDLLEIRTENWSMTRGTLLSKWTISANYTFNCGDLVILKPGVTISDFKWEQPSRDITEPVYRPYAEHFNFDDEIDYMNIIAEFSPEDMPQEVAVYVNDVCKGAQVVEDTLCQICAYILEEEPGSEIEFAFYDGERSFRSRDYTVIDNITGQVTGSDLVTGTPGSFYYVSFKDDAELPPAIKYNVRVAPNPFNPSTAICFELEEESEIKLSIYNVKGQIVKTLVNETYRPRAYQVIWDGDDQAGQKMSSGVYFYRMECGEDFINGKMLMLK
ncbi:MAG: right-handed parallel beta-helix repeat-containing protein [Candidatus Cloacimonetes bacterium]|nr:right-handed parallel beta-helix repeat-containing protein [Candidatus Cloacimonadota bacterium]